jgi:aryl-alcohol dehydrogenase-like predicted oxidoreductase
VIAYSPMGSGMLTGKMTRARIDQLPEDDWRKHDARFNEPQISRNLDLVDPILTAAAFELTDEDFAEIEGGIR